MEKLKIICYKCNSLSDSIDTCSSCKYDLSETKMLATTVVFAYNQAIELIKKKNIVKAWELVKTHLQIYPYIFDFLRFAFWLAVENGDYDNAFRILNRLKQVMSIEDYQINISILKSHIGLHNEIISGKFDYDNLDDTELSLHHYYILFLQTKDDKQTHILNKIKTIDDNFARSLTSGKILPSFRKMTLIKGGILFIVGIIGVLYNYYEYNQRQDLIEKLVTAQKNYSASLDSLDKEKDKLAIDNEHLKNDNTFSNRDKIRLSSIINKKDNDIKILKAMQSGLYDERLIREKTISELVKNNSTMLSQLKNSQEILIKSQTDSINLTESIKDLSELSQSLKQQGEKYKNVIESQKNRQEQEREFFALILRNQFKQGAELLETSEFKEFFGDSANFIYELLCEKLYDEEDYETLLKMDYECRKKPDAFYEVFLKLQNDPDRIKNIIEFIDMFPKNENYSAPFLLELVKSFNSKGDSTKATFYALLLIEHVDMYPDHFQYYNSTVKSVIEKDK